MNVVIFLKVHIAEECSGDTDMNVKPLKRIKIKTIFIKYVRFHILLYPFAWVTLMPLVLIGIMAYHP
jgi:hypothetical protein